jgi:hypothetical protein
LVLSAFSTILFLSDHWHSFFSYIKKNFHILKNDSESWSAKTFSIFSVNPLVPFRHSQNIHETLVHSPLSQDSSSQNGTFPCRAPQCKTCTWFYRFCYYHFGTKISIPCKVPLHVHLRLPSHLLHLMQ